MYNHDVESVGAMDNLKFQLFQIPESASRLERGVSGIETNKTKGRKSANMKKSGVTAKYRVESVAMIIYFTV